MLDLMGFKEEFVSQCRSTLCESGEDDMKIEERKVNKAQRGVLNGVLFRKEGLECLAVSVAGSRPLLPDVDAVLLRRG